MLHIVVQYDARSLVLNTTYEPAGESNLDIPFRNVLCSFVYEFLEVIQEIIWGYLVCLFNKFMLKVSNEVQKFL